MKQGKRMRQSPRARKMLRSRDRDERLRRQEQAADAHARRLEACCSVEYVPGVPFVVGGRWFVVGKRLHEDDEE